MKTTSDPCLLKRLFLILCLAYTISVPAQNIATDEVRWRASGFIDLLSNAVVNDAPCEFITHGTHKIEWVQGNGSYVITLNVTGISGTWADISGPGTVILSVSGEGLSGQVTFSRNEAGIKAELYLTGGTTDIKNLYTIETLEKI